MAAFAVDTLAPSVFARQGTALQCACQNSSLPRRGFNRVTAFVLKYNKAEGLAIVCPLTSVIKPYPFALRVHIKGRDGCVLTDHVKSMDWQVRRADFYDKVPDSVSEQAQNLLAVLLGIQ